jgi:O-antigen/teichoic acid export membrane protein
MSEMKKTLGHAAIYAAGVLAGRMVSIIMLPIYTRFLTTDDYGVLELLMMTTDVVSLVVGAGIVSGLFKFYFQADSERERNEVVSTSYLLLLVTYGPTVALATFASGHISSLVFGHESYSLAVKIVFVTLFFQISSVFSLSYVRALQRPVFFVTVNVVRLVMQLGFNIYFVVVLRLGVMGAVYSDLVTSATIGILLGVFTFRKVGFRFNVAKAREILRFGAPFVLTNIGAFVLTFSDRFFIRHFWDLSYVGV